MVWPSLCSFFGDGVDGPESSQTLELFQQDTMLRAAVCDVPEGLDGVHGG